MNTENAAATPTEPAEVRMLTSPELEACWNESLGTLMGYGPFARAIEAACAEAWGVKLATTKETTR